MSGWKRNNANSYPNGSFKKQKPNPQKQNSSNKPSKAHPIRDANKTNPILMGKQGFSISYNRNAYDCTKSFGAEALDLLNQYADKIYRNKGKSCYFAQRLTDIPPVFIETDIPDPSVIVDAMYQDINKPPEKRLVKDVEKISCWTKFLPVHVTCPSTPEIMVKNAKEILQPVMVQQVIPRPLKYIINMKCKMIGKVAVKNMEEELHNYIASSSVAHTNVSVGQTNKRKGEAGHDAELRLMVTGNSCWVSWLPKIQEYREYSVKDYYNKVADGDSNKSMPETKTLRNKEIQEGDDKVEV